MPFILLSATVPRKYENYFEVLFCGYLKVIRSSKINNNIEYNVREFDTLTSIIAELKRQMEKKFESLNGRLGITVIFCQRINMGKALKKQFENYQTEFYHGDLSEEEKREVEKKVRERRVNIVFATLAFGLGIDLPDIDSIFMIGMFDSIFDVVQMSGRGGRNGSTKKCQAFNFFTKGLIKEYEELQNLGSNSEKFGKSRKEDQKQLEGWLLNSEKCRLTGISQFLHDKYTDCGMNSNPLCDICRKEMGEVEQEEVLNEREVQEKRHFSPLSASISQPTPLRASITQQISGEGTGLQLSTVMAPNSPSMNRAFSIGKSIVRQSENVKSPFIATPGITRARDVLTANDLSLPQSSPISPSIIKRSMTAEKEAVHESVLIDQLLEFFEEFKSICIVCAFYGQRQQHGLGDCKIVKGKCLKCFESGHGIAMCKYKTLPKQVCFICGMKGEINGIRIHNKDTFGKRCDCLAKDKILPLLALIYINEFRNGQINSNQGFGEWRDDQIGPKNTFLETVNKWFKNFNSPSTPSSILKKRNTENWSGSKVSMENFFFKKKC